MHFVLIVGAGERLLSNFLALRLCKIWRDQGHKISITTSQPVRGDCALLHIDTTKIEPGLLSIFDADMPILNRRVLDISKRHVSRCLVSRDDDYDGYVIVKTNENAYGIPKFPPSPAHDKTMILRRSVTLHNWRYVEMLPTGTYPILANKREVPDWVWSREDIVVEQFIPEIEDGLFVLRLWVFFGPEEVGFKLYGRHPIVKSGDLVRYEFLDEVPEQLRLERRRLGFDFGKFDYVMSGGKAVLLDANKTPTVSNAERVRAYELSLAGALSKMFPDRIR